MKKTSEDAVKQKLTLGNLQDLVESQNAIIDQQTNVINQLIEAAKVRELAINDLEEKLSLMAAEASVLLCL